MMAEQFIVKSVADLDRIRDEYHANRRQYQSEVLICSGAGCVSSNCHAVRDALVKALEDLKLREKVMLTTTGCIGCCDLGPVMVIQPDAVIYTRLQPVDIPEIVHSHLVLGQIKLDRTYRDKRSGSYIPYIKDIPYFKKQVKIALRNCGSIQYDSLAAYIARNGYQALAKALKELSSEQVIATVKQSGLRGRGGGGFPVGIKWEAGRNAPGTIKYIACNADEGDPGAFMDRSILEGDPHSVIEGMMLAGYAIGASKGYIYIRAEYPWP